MNPIFHPLRLLACFLLLSTLRAQTIPNPSFEAQTFTIGPGYASGNGNTITGWTFSGNAGLNPADGNPFANNGAVPHGTNVAFLQSGPSLNTQLSTTISGLTAGTVYRVSFRANQRTGTAPSASWSLNGAPSSSFSASPAVGGSAAYYPSSLSDFQFLQSASICR